MAGVRGRGLLRAAHWAVGDGGHRGSADSRRARGATAHCASESEAGGATRQTRSVRLPGPQHRLHDALQHDMSGDQPADARRVMQLGRRAAPEPEATQNASDGPSTSSSLARSGLRPTSSARSSYAGSCQRRFDLPRKCRGKCPHSAACSVDLTRGGRPRRRGGSWVTTAGRLRSVSGTRSTCWRSR